MFVLTYVCIACSTYADTVTSLASCTECDGSKCTAGTCEVGFQNFDNAGDGTCDACISAGSTHALSGVVLLLVGMLL